MARTAAKPTKAAPDFKSTFAQLKPILAKHARELKIAKDEPGDYCLETRAAAFRGKPVFFGAASIRKSYVSFYLMPLYIFPELDKQVSPALKKRMQGKSCFNFTTPDAKLFAELRKLAAAGLERYRKEKWL